MYIYVYYFQAYSLCGGRQAALVEHEALQEGDVIFLLADAVSSMSVSLP